MAGVSPLLALAKRIHLLYLGTQSIFACCNNAYIIVHKCRVDALNCHTMKKGSVVSVLVCEYRTILFQEASVRQEANGHWNVEIHHGLRALCAHSTTANIANNRIDYR